MPTQIPAKTEHSRTAAAKAALMLSLLAAAIMGATAYIIIWFYS